MFFSLFCFEKSTFNLSVAAATVIDFQWGVDVCSKGVDILDKQDAADYQTIMCTTRSCIYVCMLDEGYFLQKS